MRKFILVSGYKGSGKDYVADALSKLIPNSKVVSFADPLKDIICTTMNITRGELDEFKNNNEVLYVGDNIPITDFRSILQRFGTEAMKTHFGQNVWVDFLLNKIPKEGVIIVSDWRFQNEYLQLTMTSNQITTVRVADYKKIGCEHSSEIDLDLFTFDVILDNTNKGDLDYSKVLNLVGS